VAPVCPLLRNKQAERRRATLAAPRIEGVEMRKVYYNRLLKTNHLNSILALLLAAMPGAPQQPASLRTASLQSHEAMTITGASLDGSCTLQTGSSQKKSPFAAGVLAVMVAFRTIPTRGKAESRPHPPDVRIDEEKPSAAGTPLTPDQSRMRRWRQAGRTRPSPERIPVSHRSAQDHARQELV